MNERIEHLAELLKTKKELEREIALMREKYEKAMRDQKLLMRELEKLREENERLHGKSKKVDI
ncbi:hypothetical protein E3E31_09265 [Thermococcus sp. M39]|uniref:hypothetical protein n=1 Tax=unclassified Thermococcus TaxID=2627626 RepID=UPI00143880F1|nr:MULTISPECIES: hypothetical protein [unclassified Thermococcus]NJE08706.1 hypothetical protein [Thermococcus sp. M39]NJE12992.1 hypothetical protein [Thermococcus sp. LS2]